jgi:hypothetical protein
MRDKPAEYRFRIDAWTPETLPMARLVKYLDELVTLFGNDEHVHFKAVRKGSAAPALCVDWEARPKVDGRLALANSPSPPDDIREATLRINKLLREDNASAYLRTPEGAKVIAFPGRTLTTVDEVTVSEQGEIDGMVVRVGGKDQSAHVTLELAKGSWANCTVSREVAKALGPYLYGEPVRMFGRGRWRRDVDGHWLLEHFNGERFEALGSETLGEALLDLAAVRNNRWNELDDPLAELKKLRKGG